MKLFWSFKSEPEERKPNMMGKNKLDLVVPSV